MGSEKSKGPERARQRRPERAKKARECQKGKESARESERRPERARKGQREPNSTQFFLRIFFRNKGFFPLRFFIKGEEKECQKEHQKGQEGKESAREEREKARKSQKRPESARGQREPERRAECPKNGP